MREHESSQKIIIDTLEIFCFDGEQSYEISFYFFFGLLSGLMNVLNWVSQAARDWSSVSASLIRQEFHFLASIRRNFSLEMKFIKLFQRWHIASEFMAEVMHTGWHVGIFVRSFCSVHIENAPKSSWLESIRFLHVRRSKLKAEVKWSNDDRWPK